MEHNDKIKNQTQNVRRTSVGWMLKNLYSSLDAEMNKELEYLDLNINQFAVMMTLLENEGLTQAQIGKKIAMPGYSTTRTMDVLEEKKYLERRVDERSRRSYRIYLTDLGHAVGPELFAIVKRVNARLLSPLSEQEQAQLVGLLETLLLARPDENLSDELGN